MGQIKNIKLHIVTDIKICQNNGGVITIHLLKMATNYSMIVLVFMTTLMGLYIAPPVDRKAAEQKPPVPDDLFNTDYMTKDQAQDQEYFRYLTQVVTELEKDAAFKAVLNNATEDDIKSGKIVEHMDLVNRGVRQKLDEVKRMEIEYQRDLVRKEKDHMVGVTVITGIRYTMITKKHLKKMT